MPLFLPLQVLDAQVHELPRWHCLDGSRPPAWVRRIAIAHALGQVDVVEWMYTQAGTWVSAIDLDSVVFSWRYDGDGVWTICSVWFDNDADPNAPPGID